MTAAAPDEGGTGRAAPPGVVGGGLASSVYSGWVRHRRYLPTAHAFSYRLFLMYLDLDELPTLFARRWLWRYERRGVAAFRRADYLGDASLGLADAVRQRVASALGFVPGGPVRVLTHLRYAGYCFNPVSFYYCFAAHGGALEAIVAEITNTPWGKRHAYVLDARAQRSLRSPRFRFDKAFHVSPFMAMAHEYDWRVGVPGKRLTVHMQNHRAGTRWFDATLSLTRRPITTATLAATLLRFPFMTAQVVAAIHWQAARLWWKGVPVVPHPGLALRDVATPPRLDPGEPAP